MTRLRRWQVAALWAHGATVGVLVCAGWWVVLVALHAVLASVVAAVYLAPLGDPFPRTRNSPLAHQPPRL